MFEFLKKKKNKKIVDKYVRFDNNILMNDILNKAENIPVYLAGKNGDDFVVLVMPIYLKKPSYKNEYKNLLNKVFNAQNTK